MTERYRQLAADAVGAATRAGASYVDARVVERRDQDMRSRNGRLAACTDELSRGVGVRVIADGAWGFASVGSTERAAVEAAARRAVDIARAAAVVQPAPVERWPVEPAVGRWESPVQVDPFALSLSERRDALLAADAGVSGRIIGSAANARAIRIDQWFVSSEGAELEQRRTVCGGGAEVTASNGEVVQRRSAPASFDGQWGLGGWERFDALALRDQHGRIRDEARRLLDADDCPATTTELILEGSQLALQIHESIGHPLEADRFFGWEDAYAGGTYLDPDDIGTRDVAAPHVSVVANSTEPGGLGTFGWDDDGVPASQWDLIRDGRLTGVLGNRELAARLNNPSATGAHRAADWSRLPLVRMVNVSLEPGAGTLEDLVASTERGVLMETNRSWSIDDRRLNFQFGCELGWEIVDGERTRLLRNPTYGGETPSFWRSCDAIAGPEAYVLWGFLICGKGQPGQMMMLSHGCAPARFRGVRIGGGYVRGSR